RIARRERDVGNQAQAAAVLPAARPDSHLAAAGGSRGVPQVLDEGLAPVEALLEAEAGIALGRPGRHSGEALRNAVDGEALEPPRNEHVDAPPRIEIELEAEAVRAQVEMPALVEVDRQQIEAHAVAAVRRCLYLERGAQPGAVVRDEIREEIAGRGRGTE